MKVGPAGLPLAGAAVPGVKGDVAERLDLDEAACARKLAAVRAYQPLAEEARRIMSRIHGVADLRAETLVKAARIFAAFKPDRDAPV